MESESVVQDSLYRSISQLLDNCVHVRTGLYFMQKYQTAICQDQVSFAHSPARLYPTGPMAMLPNNDFYF